MRPALAGAAAGGLVSVTFWWLRAWLLDYWHSADPDRPWWLP